MAKTKSPRSGALLIFLLSRLFAAIGIGAWGFAIYQLYDIVASAFSAPGLRDGGSNNLGAGIGWLFLVGYVLLAALLAAMASWLATAFTQDPADQRVLKFAIIANLSVLGLPLLIAIYFGVFPR